MARYQFEETVYFLNRETADPQVIGDELEKILIKNAGRLKPDDVIAEARRPRHPLHRYFEWDNNKAAEAYRLDQARALIRSVKIVDVGDVRQSAARAYHSIQDNGRAYRSVTEIQASSWLQMKLHEAALRDLMAWETRYRTIETICPLVKVAREALAAEVAAMKPPPGEKGGDAHVAR